jgi:hypothetical protein
MHVFGYVLYLCHVAQVLSGDLEATLLALAGELSKSNKENTLEEQAAVLLRLPQQLADVTAQLCQKLQKIPLPPLGQLAAPLGSLHPLPPASLLQMLATTAFAVPW